MKTELDYINIEPVKVHIEPIQFEVDFEPYDPEDFIKEAFGEYGTYVEIDMVSEHKDKLIEELCCYYEDDILKKLDIDDIINFLEKDGYTVRED